MGESDAKTWFPVFVRKIGMVDSRRLIHSLKVGLALTLASLLVLLNEPYAWIGRNSIWAVLSVVVVFETSAGATLSKGLNRGMGTVLAGFLALGAAHLTDLLYEPGEPILIGAVIFLAGTISTFVRAIPGVKKKFDYGVVIFMLTFCMVLVSGYRVGNEVRTASDRLLTIMIGGLVCLVVSSFLFPHWAGEDLHRLAADNFDKLGNALEECVRQYLSGEAQPITSAMIVNQTDVDPVYNACREAIKSRSTEEALVVFASWEPPHGRFRLGYPWKQYPKLGAMLRHCAYSVLALHGCLRSEIQAPSALRILFSNELRRASQDAADLLHELGDCIRTMRKPKGSTTDLLQKVTLAADDIKKSIIKHSYLLATPESWEALEGHLEEYVSTVTRVSRPGRGTVPGQSKLANPTHMPSEGALATSRQIHCIERAKPIKNYDQESLHQVRTMKQDTKAQWRNTSWDCSFDENDTSKLCAGMHGSDEDVSKSEALAKGGSWPISIKAVKLRTVLNEDAALNRSSHLETKLSSTLGPKSLTNLRDDNIASALSLVTFSSLLVESLARLDHVVEAVESLSKSGRFKACTCGTRRATRVQVEPVDEDCSLSVHSLREDDGKRSSSRMDGREFRLQKSSKPFDEQEFYKAPVHRNSSVGGIAIHGPQGN